MTIEELKEIVKDATQQAFDGQRISPDEKGTTWSIIAGERLWFRVLLDSVEAEPTKKGRWLPSDKGDCLYTCSECGFVRDAYILEEKAYCPRCGSDMREVKK